jgi:CRP/FNR family transcriptional regulator
MIGHVQMHEKCNNCGLRSEDYFCRLSEEAQAAFVALKVTHLYPKGSTLFFEGQDPEGVYVLCSGRVKLSACSQGGKAMIFRVAEAGEVLGLSACTSDVEHEATAEVLENCQVNFVRKPDFLRFLLRYNEAAVKALRQLSRNYHKVHAQVRSLGLSASAADKLANLILEWCDSDPSHNGHARIHLLYTHEELAEMIGTSRETVTRIFAHLRTRGLIVNEGSTLHIPDVARFERSVGSGRSSRRV